MRKPLNRIARDRGLPRLGLLCAALLLAAANPLQAKVTPEEAAKLGKELTPMGSEAAGNAAGTIPAWQPIEKMSTPRSFNPYEAEKPLYTVTAQNMAQYDAVLTEGYKALLKAYPKTYTLPVYPSHRNAAYPEWFLDASKQNATTVELTNKGNGFCCAAKGYPFPIPKSGIEAMWNHIMRYNTTGFRGYLNSAATLPDGSHTVERTYLELAYVYNNPKTTLDNLKNQNLNLMVKVVAPPVKVDGAQLIRVPLDRIAQPIDAFLVYPGNGRVLRGVDNGYDFPLYDGLLTYDQVDMFKGPLDRYDVKLVGKKELLVPYNSYELYSDKIKYKDIITPGHINQTLARYELHRVWVLEANVREGFTHRYKKRFFYLDEDSWIVLTQDMYDERGQFWRTAESHAINFTDVPVVINGVQVHYDIQSRRYVILNMTNEEKKFIEYNWDEKAIYFQPNNLAKFDKGKYE